MLKSSAVLADACCEAGFRQQPDNERLRAEESEVNRLIRNAGRENVPAITGPEEWSEKVVEPSR